MSLYQSINPNAQIGQLNYPGQRRPTSAADLQQDQYVAGAENTSQFQAAQGDPVKQALAVLQYQSDSDPNFQLPPGYVKDASGAISIDQSNPWYYKAALGAVAGILSLGVGSAIAGAAGAGAGGAADATGAGAGTGAATGTGTGAGVGAGTGGGLSTGGVLSALTKIGQLAGPQAAASAAGRAQQASIQNQYDQNALNFYKTGLSNAINTPAALAKNAAAGDILSNLQDVNISGLPTALQGRVPTITGGLRPSDLGPNARAAGQQLSRGALLNLMNGNFSLPQMPTQTPLPTPSGYDSAMKWLSNIGAFSGLVPQNNGRTFAPLAGTNAEDIIGGLTDPQSFSDWLSSTGVGM